VTCLRAGAARPVTCPPKGTGPSLGRTSRPIEVERAAGYTKCGRSGKR
jgi:hypothetical protein